MSLGVHRFDNPPVKLPSQKAFSLLSAGKGKAEPLRYALAPGDRTVEITTKLTSRRLKAGTWGPKQSLPPIKNAITLALAGTSLRATALPGVVAGKVTAETTQYLEGWNALEGREIDIALDDRGRLGDITIDAKGPSKDSLTDELTQRLLAIVVPVPDEPVGVGASWRVVTVLRQHPAIVKQTATYTLLARTAKKWKIGVNIRRVGERQTILDPSIPDGTVLELAALLRRFEGTIEIDPTRPLPTGRLEFSSTLHVIINQYQRGRSEEIVDDTGTVELAIKKQ